MIDYTYKPGSQGGDSPEPNEPAGKKTPLTPVPQSLFKTANSLDEVIVYANAQLPTVDRNLLYALFMMYHNTLLDLVDQSKDNSQ